MPKGKRHGAQLSSRLPWRRQRDQDPQRAGEPVRAASQPGTMLSPLAPKAHDFGYTERFSKEKGYGLVLKENWQESCERYTAFWNGASLDRPPVFFDSIGSLKHPMYHGVGYDYQKYRDDVETYCRDYERIWEARAGCIDDTMPSICPQMGGAIEAAFFGGQIEWGNETSSLVPYAPLADVAELEDIRFSSDNEYHKRALAEVRKLSSLSSNRFGVNFEASISLTTTISQLRGGTRFMLDLVDDPEGIRALAETVADVLIRLQSEVDNVVPHPAGGTCHRWLNYWNPGGGFWFSEDDAILMSAGMYRDLFMDLDRRLCDAAGCAVLHWHTGGMHLIDTLLEINGLRMIQLSFDPNGPPLSDVLTHCQRIVDAGRKVCFQIGYDAQQVRTVFFRLPPDSCMFYFGHAHDVPHANKIVREVEQLARTTRRKANHR